MTDREARRDALLAAEAANPQHGLWWLSFVDNDRPEGDRFIGACIVEADGPVSAVREAHARGCNPGGEVSIMGPMPLDNAGPWTEETRNRVLTRAEIDEIEKDL